MLLTLIALPAFVGLLGIACLDEKRVGVGARPVVAAHPAPSHAAATIGMMAPRSIPVVLDPFIPPISPTAHFWSDLGLVAFDLSWFEQLVVIDVKFGEEAQRVCPQFGFGQTAIVIGVGLSEPSAHRIGLTERRSVRPATRRDEHLQ